MCCEQYGTDLHDKLAYPQEKLAALLQCAISCIHLTVNVFRKLVNVMVFDNVVLCRCP